MLIQRAFASTLFSFFEEAMPHILTLSTDLFSNYV